MILEIIETFFLWSRRFLEKLFRYFYPAHAGSVRNPEPAHAGSVRNPEPAHAGSVRNPEPAHADSVRSPEPAHADSVRSPISLPINDAFFFTLEKLPHELILGIADFLTGDRHSFLKGFVKNLDNRNSRIHELFLYRIAVQTEDNQNSSKSILEQLFHKKRYQLIATLIQTPREMKDAAGRVFKSISAWGYVYWAGDRHMYNMLVKYVNLIREKNIFIGSKVSKQIQDIRDSGIAFTFQGESFVGSKFFDPTALVNAQKQAFQALEKHGHSHIFYGHVNELNKQLSQLPTHMVQEFCLERRGNGTIQQQRTAVFYRCNQFYESFDFNGKGYRSDVFNNDRFFIKKSWFKSIPFEKDSFFVIQCKLWNPHVFRMTHWPRFQACEFSFGHLDTLIREWKTNVVFTEDLANQVFDFHRQV